MVLDKAPELLNSARDQLLIGTLRGGDSSAVDGLFRRHFPTASDVALRLTGDPRRAEDLVRVSFQTTFDNIEAGAGPVRHFRAYLLTLMRALAT